VYVARYERGTARLFAVDVATDQWRAITPDTLSVSHYAVARHGKTILVVLDNANQPQELYRLDPATGELTRLTRGAGAVPPVRLGHIEQLAWPSDDGRFTVHGFLIKPPAYDSTRRYPLVVLVHGGPGALFTNSFTSLNFGQQGYPPPQWLASAGYLVLMANPRGDRSYGEAFAAALHEDWTLGPFGDINAGVSALIARGLVDSTAIGIAGWSYGGYLTAYAITQTHRFAAASIDDGPTDLRIDYAINYAIHSATLVQAFDGTPWARPDIYAAQSPITYVNRIRTPVLMRYGGRGSTGDNIRPAYMLAQGLELYAGLRDTGVPVQFVLHPDQGHGVVDWALYKDWVMRNVRWFDYWLKGEGTKPAVSAR
jgi:dipeptidyl aminopeptidase/acylaminoacyl peptidase